jgi:hypothetical protein
MSDTLQALGGFALIIGLFVAYFWERRAKRRAALPRPEPPRPVEPVTTPAERGSRSSINWGAPFLYCLLLVGVARGSVVWYWISLIVYTVFLIVAVYSTLSPKELAAEQRRRPGTTRADHYLKLGVPYLLFPGAALALVLSGRVWAVLLPAVPWLLIIPLALIVLPATAVSQWWSRRQKPPA